MYTRCYEGTQPYILYSLRSTSTTRYTCMHERLCISQVAYPLSHRTQRNEGVSSLKHHQAILNNCPTHPLSLPHL